MPRTDKIAQEIWGMIQNRMEIYDLTREEIMEVFDGLAANCCDVVEDLDPDDDEDFYDDDEDDNFENDWDDEDDFEEDID